MFLPYRGVSSTSTPLLSSCLSVPLTLSSTCSGAVYFKIPGDDIAAIQSKISIIFLTIAFGGVIAFQTPLP